MIRPAGSGPCSVQAGEQVNLFSDTQGLQREPGVFQAMRASAYAAVRMRMTWHSPRSSRWQQKGYAVQACSAAGCSGWADAPNLTDVESKGRQQAVPASGSSGR